MNNITLTKENTVDVIRELEEAFYDIPFENSSFQNEAFVIASQITPERAYRAIGLRMMSKLRALNEAKFSAMKLQVDLDEIDHKIASGTLNPFDLRREQIKREEMLSHSYWTDKLTNDAVTELNTLYAHFKALPKFTREQFEQAERVHFEQRLNRQVLGLDDAKGSLINMNEDLKALNQYEEKSLQLGAPSDEDIKHMLLTLPNLLKENK